MERRIRKTILLGMLLCVALLLTACYVPPDDVNGDSENLTVGSSSVPFQTIPPTSSPTPPSGRVTCAATPAMIVWESFRFPL